MDGAGPTPINSETQIPLTMSALQVSVILAALWKAPLSAEVVMPLIRWLETELKRAAPQPNGGVMTESAHVSD